MDAQKYYDRKLEKNSDSEIRSAMERSGKWAPEQLQGIVSATLPVPSSPVTPPVQSSAIPVAATPSPLGAWTTQKFPAQAEYAKRIQKYVGNDREKAKFLLKTQNQPSGWDPARLVEAYPNDPNIPASLRTGQLNPDDQEAQAWVAARHYDRGETFINRMASGGGDPRESNEWLNNPGKRAAMRHAYFLGGEKEVSDAIGHGGQQYLQWMHQNTDLPVQEHINAMMAVESQFADFPRNLRPSPTVIQKIDPIPEATLEKTPVVIQETEKRDPILETVLEETDDAEKETWPEWGERALTEGTERLFEPLRRVRSVADDILSPFGPGPTGEMEPRSTTQRRMARPFAQFARAFNDMLLIPGLVTAEEEPGLAKQLHGWVEEKIQQVDLDPQDVTMADDVLGAIGTMAAFFVPSTLAAKGTLALAKGGPQAMRLAGFLSRSGIQVFPAAVMESAGESGRAYQDILAKDGDAEAARLTSGKLFGVNIIFNAMLNKLSGIFDALPREARRQGFTTLGEASSWLANNPGLGGKAARASIEGIQEMQQHVAGALARENNVKVAEMFYEGGVGSLAAAIFGLRGRRGRPIEEILREGKQRYESPLSRTEAVKGRLTPVRRVPSPLDTAGSDLDAVEAQAGTAEAIEDTAEAIEDTAVTSTDLEEAAEEAEKWQYTGGPPGFRVQVKLASGKRVVNPNPDMAFDHLYGLVKEGWGDTGGVDRSGTEESSLVEEMLPSKVARKTGQEPVLVGEELKKRTEARKATGFALRKSLLVVNDAESKSDPLTEEEAEQYQIAQNFLYTYDNEISKDRKLALDSWLISEEGGWSAKEVGILGLYAEYAKPLRVASELVGEKQSPRQLKQEIGDLEEQGIADESYPDKSPHQQAGPSELSPENKSVLESGPPQSLLNVEGVSEEDARAAGLLGPTKTDPYQENIETLARDLQKQDPPEGPRSPLGGQAKLEMRGEVANRAQTLLEDVEKILGPRLSDIDLAARKEKTPAPIMDKRAYAKTHPGTTAGRDPEVESEALGLDEIVIHEDLEALVKRADAARIHIADVMVPVHRSREALETAATEGIPLSPVRADDPWRKTGRTNVPPIEKGVEKPFDTADDMTLPVGLAYAAPSKIHVSRPARIEGQTPLESEKAEKITRANIERRAKAQAAAKSQSLEDLRRAVQESESEAAAILQQRLLASNRAHYMHEGEQRKATAAEERRAAQGEGIKRDTAFKEEVNIPTGGLRKRYPPWSPEEVQRRKEEQRARPIPETPAPLRRAARDQTILMPGDVAALIQNTTAATDPEVIRLLKEHAELTSATRKDMRMRGALEIALEANPADEQRQKQLRDIIEAQTLSSEAQTEVDVLVESIGAAIEQNQKTTGSNAGDTIVLPSVGNRHRKGIINQLIDAWNVPFRTKGTTHEEVRESLRRKYKTGVEREAAARATRKAQFAVKELTRKKAVAATAMMSPTLEKEVDPIPDKALADAEEARKVARNARAREKTRLARQERNRKKEIADAEAATAKLRKQIASAEAKAKKLADAQARRATAAANKAAKKAAGKKVAPAKKRAKKTKPAKITSSEKANYEKGLDQPWVPQGEGLIARIPKNFDMSTILGLRNFLNVQKQAGHTYEKAVALLRDPDAGRLRQYSLEEVHSIVRMLDLPVRTGAIGPGTRRPKSTKVNIPETVTPTVGKSVIRRVSPSKEMRAAARDLHLETRELTKALDSDMMDLYDSLDPKQHPMPETPELRLKEVKAWASGK